MKKKLFLITFIVAFFYSKAQNEDIIIRDSMFLKRKIYDKTLNLHLNKRIYGKKLEYEKSEAIFYYEPLIVFLKKDTVIFSNVNVGINYIVFYDDYFIEKLIPPLNNEVFLNYYLKKFKITINENKYYKSLKKLETQIRLKKLHSFIDLEIELLDVNENECKKNLEKLFNEKCFNIKKVKKGYTSTKSFFLFPDIIIGMNKTTFLNNFPLEIRQEIKNANTFINLNDFLIESINDEQMKEHTLSKCWLDIIILQFKEERLNSIKFLKTDY